MFISKYSLIFKHIQNDLLILLIPNENGKMTTVTKNKQAKNQITSKKPFYESLSFLQLSLPHTFKHFLPFKE